MMQDHKQWFGLERYFPDQARQEVLVWKVSCAGSGDRYGVLREEFRFDGEEGLKGRIALREAGDGRFDEPLAVVRRGGLTQDLDTPLSRCYGAKEWLGHRWIKACAQSDFRELWDEHFRQMAEIQELEERRRALGEGVGRNDRCPCESGRKYKKCCRRKAADLEAKIPRQHSLGVTEMVPAWREQARQDPLGQFFAIVERYEETGEVWRDRALEVAEELGLALGEASEGTGELDDPWWVPGAWVERLEALEEPVQGVAQGMLPLIAAGLSDEEAPWGEISRLYYRALGCGLRDGRGGEGGEQLDIEWSYFRRWLKGVEARGGEDWEPSEHYLRSVECGLEYILEECQELLDEDGQECSEGAEGALELLATITGDCDGVIPEWANEAAVYRFAGLVNQERHGEAIAVLEGVAKRRVTRAYIPVYLGDLFLDYGMHWEGEELELIRCQARRYAEAFEGRQRDLLLRLDEALEELKAATEASI